MNHKTATLLLLTAFLLAGCSGDSENASNTNASSDNQSTTKRPGLLSTDAEPDLRESQVRPGTMAEEAKTADRSGSTPSENAPSRTVASNNGLFPDMGMGDSSSRFGGALFPDFTPAEDGQAANLAVTQVDSDSDPFDLGDNFFEGQQVGSGTTASATASQPVSVARKISLLPQARLLFEQQREADAVKLLYANYLVSDQCREEYPLNWFAGLKEPRLFFRWGVGVIYKQPRDFEGRHPVIGDPGDENENVSGGGSRAPRGPGGRGGLGFAGTGGGGSAGGSRGARAYKNVDTSRPDGFLMYYTGDFGERLISFLDQRRTDQDRPHYGKILNDVMEAALPEDEDESDKANAAAAVGGRRGRPNAPGNAAQIGSLNLGPDGGNGGRGQGNGGAQPVVRTDTSVLDRAMGRSTAEKPEDGMSGSVIPGVMLLGVGSKAELVERAKAAELDSLFVFNVKISKSRRSSSPNRSAPSQFNTTSLRIIDLQQDNHQNLFNSKALKDTDVAESLEEGEDPVTEEMERAFDTLVDKEFLADPLPDALNSENVRRRVGRLIQDQPANPLPAAVEVIGFLQQELLSEQDAITALGRLFDSPDAAVLITGTTSQRIEFVRPWLPDDIEI